MVRTAAVWKSLVSASQCHVTPNTYDAILQDQVHLLGHTLFPNDGPIIQEHDSSIHTAKMLMASAAQSPISRPPN